MSHRPSVLEQRKLVQWALAYLADAWVVRGCRICWEATVTVSGTEVRT